MSGAASFLSAQDLNPNDFKLIEKLLYDYPYYNEMIARQTKELDQLLEDLTPNASSSIVTLSYTKGYRAGSEPERWTIKRDEHPRARQLRRELDRNQLHKVTIENSMMRLNKDERQFIELHYFKGKNIKACCREMLYCKSQVYRIRQRVVLNTASFLGII